MSSNIDRLLARLEYLGITDSMVLDLVDDISKENENLEQQLSSTTKELNFDQLTGLPNKSSFIAFLQKQLNGMKQQSQNCSKTYLAIGDIDNFKSINDQFGHSEGDRALKHLADVVQKASRASDYFARFHGDEFGFVFTRISKPEVVYKVKKRIEEALKANPFKVNGQDIVLSMSIGITPCDALVSIEENLKIADKVMYLVKGQSHRT